MALDVEKVYGVTAVGQTPQLGFEMASMVNVLPAAPRRWNVGAQVVLQEPLTRNDTGSPGAGEAGFGVMVTLPTEAAKERDAVQRSRRESRAIRDAKGVMSI